MEAQWADLLAEAAQIRSRGFAKRREWGKLRRDVMEDKTCQRS